MPHLPVVDLAALDTDDERARLRIAAHEVGFFYLTGHGVGQLEIGELFDHAGRFFALPEPEKQRIEMIASPHSAHRPTRSTLPSPTPPPL